MKTLIRLLQDVIGRVKETLVNHRYKFTISPYTFDGARIKITDKKNRRVARIRLHDIFSENMDFDSIRNALECIDLTKYRYLNIVSYDRYGIYVYLSNDFKTTYKEIKYRGYKRITIPVGKYRRQLKHMLCEILKSRYEFERKVMTDFKAEMYNDRFILSSYSNSISVSTKDLKYIVSTMESDEAYIVEQLLTKNQIKYYMVVPLSSVNMEYITRKSIIVTADQIKENIIPPTKYFMAA